MDQLQLNAPVTTYKDFYTPKTPTVIAQMPLLIAEGRTPILFPELMKRQVELPLEPEELWLAWWTNYFDTGTGLFQLPNGKAKIVNRKNALWDITPKKHLANGALPIERSVYNSYTGDDVFEFTAEEIEKYANKFLTKPEAKTNPFWIAYANGNRKLNGERVDILFREADRRYGKDETRMGIWIAAAPSEPSGRLVESWGLGGSGGAGGYSSLGNCGGRLVGVGPSVQAPGVSPGRAENARPSETEVRAAVNAAFDSIYNK